MAQQKQQVHIAEYKDTNDMRRGVTKMTAAGWQVVSTTQKERRRGCLARIMWLPWMANKRAHYLVTYNRG